jgi:hypothetical protein
LGKDRGQHIVAHSIPSKDHILMEMKSENHLPKWDVRRRRPPHK